MIPLRYPIAATLAALTIAFLVVLAFRAWRTRTSSQEQFLPMPLRSIETSSSLCEGHYVATTYAEDPLNRVTAHGLGNRGKAIFALGQSGLLIDRAGEHPLAIESSKIHSVKLTNATIDRGVEANGLIQIDWQLADVVLSTFIRLVALDDRHELISQIQELSKKEAAK